MSSSDRGWLSRIGPWVGLGTSPAAIMMGGGVAEGLSGARLVAALAIGVALLSLLAIAQGVLGQTSGKPLAALTAGPLGEEGSRRTASLAMLAMMLGWFGVNAGVGGTALARLIHAPDALGIALFSALMLAVTMRGLATLSWFALAAGLATTGLAAYGLHLALRGHEVSLSQGHAGSEPIGLLAGVTLVVGYAAAFAVRAPDFTHDLARARHVAWCALLGLALPVAAFGLAGALLYATTGSWDLADVLHALGSSDLAYLFVAIGFTGSVLTNIWSGALSLRDALPRLPHRPALAGMVVAGGALAATGFSDRMLSWLTILALAAPGLIVLCVMHRLLGGTTRPGWGLDGLASWALGIFIGIGLYWADSFLALPAAAAVPALAYRLLGRPRGRDLADPSLEG